MRWLLDQGLPRSTAKNLRHAGEDAIHVGEIDRWNAPDFEIIQYGRVEKRIIVTLDADFHVLLAKSGAVEPSIIRLRIEGLKGLALTNLLLTLSRDFADSLTSGCVMSVTPHNVRIRTLPIGD